jgi:hypothetical protein
MGMEETKNGKIVTANERYAAGEIQRKMVVKDTKTF